MKTYHIYLNENTDSDLISWLHSQTNVSATTRAALRFYRAFMSGGFALQTQAVERPEIDEDPEIASNLDGLLA